MSRARTSLLAGVLLLGCGGDLTELVLVLDSDMPVPAELERVDLVILGPNPEQPEVVNQTLAFTLPGAPTPPLSLGLVLDGDEVGPVIVEATGTTASGQRVVRTVTTNFVNGDSRALPLRLNARCLDVTCDRGSTCGDDGVCQTDAVPGESLPSWTGDPADFASLD